MDNGQFIGYTGFAHPTFESHFTPCVEIGWRLSKENWNQGFATEAALACLHYGFKKLAFNEIYSFTATINLPSIKVMEKIGMKKQGEFEHPALAEGHKLKTHVLYKIAKES
jgi:ribosomal-protein-alanine N-acetyltransferase